MQVSEQTKPYTALVTGASAGIGADYARELARCGFHVVLTARRTERLAAMAAQLKDEFGVDVHYFPYDLADEHAPRQLADEIEKAGLEIDFLLNNAGYTVTGAYDQADWQAQRDLLQVLLIAPLELVHIFAPLMAKRGRGFIVNVASVAGLMPGVPNGTLYGPIKSCIIKFSEAIAAEYKNAGVNVQALCPGLTMTEFHDVAGNRAVMEALPNILLLDSPSMCAASYHRVIKNKSPIFVFGLIYKVMTLMIRLMPQSFAAYLFARHDRNAAPEDKPEKMPEGKM